MIFNKNYVNKLFKFSNEIKGIDMRFEDNVIERDYLLSNFENEKSKSRLFCFITSLIYTFAIIVILFYNKFQPNRNFGFLITGLVVELFMFFITNRLNLNLNLFYIFKNLRFFTFYFVIGFVIMFPQIMPNESSPFQSRVICSFIVLMNLLYSSYLDFNFVVLVLIPVLNALLIIYFQYAYNFAKFYFAFEFALNIVYYVPTFFIKKNEFINKKKIFLESFKNEQCTDYILQLINVLNTMVISINTKINEVLFINKFALNYFKKTKNLSFREEIQEKDLLNSNNLIENEDQNASIHTYMKSFFGTLILEKPFESGSIKMNMGEPLNEIISRLSICWVSDSKEFNRIGYFKSVNEPNFFEIFVRKLNLEEEVIELLINDITEIKQAEKINSENKYKQMILAKIAHEFKTPLITIISLIQKIMSQQIEIHISIKSSLNHINNLSNYTLVLISDIIQYVSNNIKMILNKNEILVREILDFSFNVLKTLIECNENKINKINTTLEIDENVDKMTIVSDENRLKQIFLNFISNAVKFTKSGYIKIQAKYHRMNHSIEIIVEDTGLGIKIEDHSQVFKEHVQLNVDKEYNCKGSGLGLSITKTLAESLDHEIGFSSKLGEGSKFYLIMKCLNTTNKKISRQKNTRSLNNNNYISLSLRENEPSIIVLDEMNIMNNNLPISKQGFIRSNSNVYENNLQISKNSSIRSNSKVLENNITTPRHNYILYKSEFNLISINEEESQEEYRRSNLEPSSFYFSVGNFCNDDFKILVIDDHVLIRQNTANLIKSVLTSLNIFNYRIIEGSDGIDLLSLIKSDKDYKIKYIFIDENMEFLNGSEAVFLIRKLESHQKIQKYNIVSITAYDDEETRINIIKSGVNSIISKPCTKSEIMKYLKNL